MNDNEIPKIGGRYAPQKKLGVGGMGVVMEAIDTVRSESVALKLLKPTVTGNRESLSRQLMEEAKLALKLSHPNIVRLFDVGIHAGDPYISMELLKGDTLRQMMETRKREQQAIPVENAMRIVSQLLDGLNYAHRYIVHRDLKPENIWITDGNEVKLTDFGIALPAEYLGFTETKAALGTAYYVAPEILTGRSRGDARSDLYAVGVILYEMLTGVVPMGAAKEPYQLNKNIPRQVSRAVMKALSPDPSDRFATAESFQSALRDTGIASRGKAALPVINSRQALIGVSAVIGIALAAFAINAFINKSHGTGGNPKLEATRLMGEISALTQQSQVQYQETQRQVQEAQKELQSQQATGRLHEDQAKRLGVVRLALMAKAQSAQTALDLLNAGSESSEFKIRLAGDIEAARTFLSDKDYGTALEILRALSGELHSRISQLNSYKRVANVLGEARVIRGVLASSQDQRETSLATAIEQLSTKPDDVAAANALKEQVEQIKSDPKVLMAATGATVATNAELSAAAAGQARSCAQQCSAKKASCSAQAKAVSCGGSACMASAAQACVDDASCAQRSQKQQQCAAELSGCTRQKQAAVRQCNAAAQACEASC